LKLAIIGYGKVGRALARLARAQRKEYPFTITGFIRAARHAVDAAGLAADVLEAAEFGVRAASVEEFLDAARAEVAVELTTLNPSTGEPATGHIRARWRAHARGDGEQGADRARVCRTARPGGAGGGEPAVRIQRDGRRAGVQPVAARHARGEGAGVHRGAEFDVEGGDRDDERGGSFDAGLAEARRMGIAEGDGAYDVEGWDSAAKTAALANVLMDARTTPQLVATRGIARLTPERVMEMARDGKTVRLVSRGGEPAAACRCGCAPRCWSGPTFWPARRDEQPDSVPYGLDGHVRNGVDRSGVEQTAYGVFSDLVSLR